MESVLGDCRVATMVDFVHQNLFGFLIIWIVDELIPSAKNRIKLVVLVKRVRGIPAL